MSTTMRLAMVTIQIVNMSRRTASHRWAQKNMKNGRVFLSRYSFKTALKSAILLYACSVERPCTVAVKCEYMGERVIPSMRLSWRDERLKTRLISTNITISGAKPIKNHGNTAAIMPIEIKIRTIFKEDESMLKGR